MLYLDLMSKKLLFFDIDGTLWDFHNIIPESTVRGIRAAREHGHLCFINTGRSRAFVTAPHLFDVGFDGIVSGCGTMIEYRGEVPFYYRLDNDFAEEAVRTVRRYGFRPILEGRFHLYMDSEDFDGDIYGEKLKEELGDHLLSIRDHWGEWEISKMSCATRPDDHAGCMEALGDSFEFMIHSPEVVEMSPKGFTKGTAIERVCELVGADMADTIAFGDSMNDIAMLTTAGTAVVMGNGSDEAKAVATFVTDDIHEDGILHALERLELV